MRRFERDCNPCLPRHGLLRSVALHPSPGLSMFTLYHFIVVHVLLNTLSAIGVTVAVPVARGG